MPPCFNDNPDNGYKVEDLLVAHNKAVKQFTDVYG
jgi:hypothetical protein